ncbi:MAG: acyltransferase, partial [Flavobacteriaceae bacterium]
HVKFTLEGVIPMTPSTNRILSFDLLKVVALMYIIFGWHMDDYAGDILQTSIGRTLVIGALGIFVFVSGYTLTRSCGGKVENLSDAGLFIKKRFVRIYPLYLSSLILAFAVSEISSKQFLTGIFLLNAILNIHINALWFVTMIFIFYLLLPVILYTYSVARTLVLSFLFLFICVVINNSFGLMDLRLTYYFPVFVLGILCSQHDKLFLFLKSTRWAIISAIILLILTYIPQSLKFSGFKYMYIVGSLVFSLSPMIAAAELFSEVAKSNVFVRLSYASFCMYLYHRTVFYSLLQLYRPESDLMIVLFLGLAGFPLIFILSEWVQTGYDYLVRKSSKLVLSQS